MGSPFRLRHHWRPGLATVLAAAATLACHSTTDPANPTVKLSVSPASVAGPLLPPATVAVTGATVTVTGYLTTPYPCYDISATQQISGGTLIVRLTASRNAPVCAAVLATFRLVATVTQVSSDVNHVRVEQTGAVAGSPSVLVDETIAVP